MDRDDAWRAIDEQRALLVDLLDGLSDEEWRRPSLCQGWTVRECAAHVALQNTTWSMMPAAMLAAVRSGGLDGAIATLARRHAERPTEQIVAEIRDRIGVWRPLPTVGVGEAGIDYLVHTQDIALPLGRQVPMPPELSRFALETAWTSRLFAARRRLAGFRLVATDSTWQAGQGHDVTGTTGSLLLLVTGRTAAAERLGGSGAAALRARLSAPARPGR